MPLPWTLNLIFIFFARVRGCWREQLGTDFFHDALYGQQNFHLFVASPLYLVLELDEVLDQLFLSSRFQFFEFLHFFYHYVDLFLKLFLVQYRFPFHVVADQLFRPHLHFLVVQRNGLFQDVGR